MRLQLNNRRFISKVWNRVCDRSQSPFSNRQIRRERWKKRGRKWNWQWQHRTSTSLTSGPFDLHPFFKTLKILCFHSSVAIFFILIMLRALDLSALQNINIRIFWVVCIHNLHTILFWISTHTHTQSTWSNVAKMRLCLCVDDGKIMCIHDERRLLWHIRLWQQEISHSNGNFLLCFSLRLLLYYLRLLFWIIEAFSATNIPQRNISKCDFILKKHALHTTSSGHRENNECRWYKSQ